MKTYYRDFFNTNSSSAHSVIRLVSKQKVREKLPSGISQYGWENFILVSKLSKLDYVRLQFSEDKRSSDWTEDEYIDHNSRWTIPVPLRAKDNIDIIRKYIEDVISQKDTVILGGNDNEGRPPDIPYGDSVVLPIATCGNLVFRQNNESGFTVFNQETGAKFRYGPPSTDPELLDVKITSRCLNNCSFCYQASTPDGKHAPMENIEKVVKLALEKGVFEVALGGGEPTLHPNFVEILSKFRSQNIIPSFSTRNVMWFTKDNCKAIKPYVGAVALSTDDPIQALMWERMCRDNGLKPAVHYIVGLHLLSELDTFLLVVTKRIKVILLHFHENIGRAGTRPYPTDGWQDIVYKYANMYCVSVDSFLASEIKNDTRFRQESIGWRDDGVVSVYVDALTMEQKKNSFGQ